MVAGLILWLTRFREPVANTKVRMIPRKITSDAIRANQPPETDDREAPRRPQQPPASLQGLRLRGGPREIGRPAPSRDVPTAEPSASGSRSAHDPDDRRARFAASSQAPRKHNPNERPSLARLQSALRPEAAIGGEVGRSSPAPATAAKVLQRHGSPLTGGLVHNPRRDDAPTTIARPPEGENASSMNDVNPEVPGFPDLQRGSAKGDGDCFFHSVIHLARPQIAEALNMRRDEWVTPQAIREHIASDMVAGFASLNLGVVDDFFVDSFPEELGEQVLPIDLNEAKKLFRDDMSNMREQLVALTPAQRTYVADILKEQAHTSETADLFPALMAHAFPEIAVVVHNSQSKPERVDDITYRHPDAEQVHTVRVFFEREHYEPVTGKPREPGRPPG